MSKRINQIDLADEMADAISSNVEDPMFWPLEARRAIESLRLRPAEFRLVGPSLSETCAEIVRVAVVWNKTEAEIREAIRLIIVRDRS